ncbi:MAG: hypothetical protein F6K23_37885 [Okeania sp. SIO2C9]|uniref:hypothetical protein n=1 Tax=Okeania sp. SIO2C9 TaxID=2607791 RepID=UPI0013C17AB7|nr:hypothetical protein [Okeania sp. SIO2C9]NEQ78260.1 hypothetical protein [Okeania sp. SIO2C9]
MLRTPTFHVNQYQTLFQHLKQIILYWLKSFWKFSLFYGKYTASPPWQKTINIS